MAAVQEAHQIGRSEFERRRGLSHASPDSCRPRSRITFRQQSRSANGRIATQVSGYRVPDLDLD